jgi:methionine synthase II (cobalamin-independent)
MAIRFRADNIGSLLRPPELLEARTALREGRLNEERVRQIEQRRSQAFVLIIVRRVCAVGLAVVVSVPKPLRVQLIKPSL